MKIRGTYRLKEGFGIIILIYVVFAQNRTDISTVFSTVKRTLLYSLRVLFFIRCVGICPVAIGKDGGGSIRIPSTLCGVVGIKGKMS